MNCRICSTTITEKFQVKEMVLGYSDEFTYEICSNCETIQIKSIPENLTHYYPNSYYSLSKIDTLKKFNFLKAKLLYRRDLHLYGVKKSALGKIVNKLFPGTLGSMHLANQFVLKQLYSKTNPKIHDAGCGTGQFLNYFNVLGFKNLSGSDPFIDNSISYGDLKIERTEISEINETFDCITLNHVIEHVLDPKEYMQHIFKRLNLNGTCLVRTPMALSNGYLSYKENWVGLEAPRHLHVFSQKGFVDMVKEIGFKVDEIRFDTLGWHYQVSEAYKQNIPQSRLEDITFSPEKLNYFDELAEKANQEKNGDTIAYYLRK
ncbi:MAG: class I SAM-dependent methyltransferase [Fluviicola sp.]|jgi:SAM-dependent methyltransferase